MPFFAEIPGGPRLRRAAFTDASCYVLNQLESSSRAALFHEWFHPSEMGFNMGRTCIGASDYSTKAYRFDDDGPDPDLQHFSIDHDKDYILPMSREGPEGKSRLILVFLWVESAGMDEGQQLNAGRRHAAEVHVLLWQLLPEILVRIRGRGRADPSRDRAK